MFVRIPFEWQFSRLNGKRMRIVTFERLKAYEFPRKNQINV